MENCVEHGCKFEVYEEMHCDKCSEVISYSNAKYGNPHRCQECIRIRMKDYYKRKYKLRYKNSCNIF